MPFKGNLWKKLGIRNLIRHAVEGGYDSLGWTTGEQQAARYDLSKHLDSVTAMKRANGSYEITGNKNGNEVFTKLGVSSGELPNLRLGKDLADKIIQKSEPDYPGATFKYILRPRPKGWRRRDERVL